jgi:signal transduction histidine kinase
MSATSGRVVAVLAGVLLLAAVAVTPFTIDRSLDGGEIGFAVVDLVQGVCYLAAGLTLLRWRAGGPVALVLLAAGLGYALSTAAYQYGLLWLDGVPLPGGGWAIWAQTWLYLPGLGLAAIILPALLAGAPRRFLIAAAPVLIAHAVIQAIQPGPLLRSGELPNPLGVAAAANWLPIVAVASAALLIAGPLLLWRRWRLAGGADRPALSWFLAGDLLIVAALLTDLAGAALPGPYGAAFAWSLHLATLPLLPGAIVAVAVRQRSGRFPVVINHALVWSLLTLGVAWSYLLVAGWLATVLRVHAGPGVTVVAAAVVAIAFEPARSRLQRAADRLVYGDRRDPLRVLSRVTAHLSGPGRGLDGVAAEVVARLRLAGFTIHLAEAAHAHAHAGRTTTAPVTLTLLDGDRTVGSAIAYPRPGERLHPADLDLLDQIGKLLVAGAVADRNAAELRRARADLVTAREEERHRLSRDLHDDLGPALAGIALGLRAAANQVSAGTPAGVADLLDALGRESALAAGEIRRIAHDLHPPWLAEDGLVGALRKRIAALDSADGTRITLTAPGDLPELPVAVQVAAYRITAEAVSNVVRHAGATVCRIAIRWQDALTVEIADDGRGLPDHRRAGLGLTTMRARAEELDGVLDIRAGDPSGTVVRLTLAGR